jgi:hypothetical protein
MAMMMAIRAVMRSDGVEDCDAALSPWRLEQEFEVLSSQGRRINVCVVVRKIVGEPFG